MNIREIRIGILSSPPPKPVYNFKISTIFRNAIIKDEVDIAWSLYTSSSKRRDNNNNNNGNLTYADYCDLAKLLKNNGLVVDQTKIDLRLQQMEKIKSDIINSRIIHDIEIYNLLLIAYSKTKRFEGAKRFKLDHQIYVSFIHVFGNLGEIKELEIVFKDYLKLNSLKLNSSVFDSIIAQYLENKLDIEKSIAIYKQMLNKSLKPPKQTFNKIINAYFKNNQFENAKNFFLEEMEKRWNISVDIVTINTMISGNFRAALYHSGLISGGGEYDFSTVDEYARETPESNTHSIRSLSHYLTSVWDDPLYKLRAIFVWVADNITYDTESLKSQNGKDILKSRKAVCAGYSELFNDLAVDSGLDTFRISGAAKGAGYTVGSPIVSAEYAHAWNCVKYNGEYLLIDCTWGAGVVEERKFKKNFNDFYFLASPNQFIYSHLPEQPKHQYIGPTITKPEFINLPYVKPSFFKYGLIFKHFYGCEIVIKNDMLCIELEQTKLLDESINFAVNLEWSNTRNKDLCFYQNFHMIGNNGGRVHKISFGCPNRGQGQLSMFLIPEGQTWGEMTASFKVKNQGSGLKNRQFVLKYDSPSFKFTIIRPITKILGYAKKSKFEIIIVKNNHNNRSKKDNPPNLLICDADFGKKVNLEPSTTDNDYCFEEGVVYYSADVVLNHKGIWRIGYESGPNSYGFLAEYEVK
ncbi:16474_t:CDS:2 [Entrophospora sp. SA101]|nr:16474_t:CDS:2 [Entrophospora sp. SA101]CAJ0890678.1 15701_t:CDS:2 [Entrophospora sp. SA101]